MIFFDGFQMPRQSEISNRLLRALSPDAFERLRPHLEWIDLPVKTDLVRPDEPVAHVVFPERGLASIVATSGDGDRVEVGHLGNEGMSGTHVVLRVPTTPNHTFMQVAGSGFRVPVDAFHRVLEEDEAIRDLLLLYIHTREMQLSQTALANARYSMSQRLARWLLMSGDRVEGEDLALTHEFLSLMLGVRRSGVTNEIHILEGTGVIKATRANIKILDRQQLLEIAQGSYGVPEAEYERLIG